MSGQELATAVQYGLEVVVLVVDNGMYGTIRMHQERHYPGRVIGTDLVNPDFVAYAASFGATASGVERTDDFAAAFEQGARRRPAGAADLARRPEAITPRATLTEIREAARVARAPSRRDMTGDRPQTWLERPIRGFVAEVAGRGLARTDSPRGDTDGDRPRTCLGEATGKERDERPGGDSSRRPGGADQPLHGRRSCRRLLFVSGIVPVDADGHLVGGTTSSSRRDRSSATSSECSPPPARRFADVVKVTIFLTDVDDRPLDQPRAPGGVRRDAPGEHAGRGAAARRPRREDRGRGRRPRADVTATRTTPSSPGWTSPREPTAGPARGPDAPRQGPDRHRRRPHDVRLANLRRPRARAHRARRPAAPRRGRRPRRQGEPARVRLERRSARTPGTAPCDNPAHPGRTTGGSSSGNAAALAAGLVDLGLGTRHRLLDPAAVRVLRHRRAEDRGGARIPTEGVFPLVPTFDTVGPMARSVEDVALIWSVLTGKPAPEPRLDGLTRRRC